MARGRVFIDWRLVFFALIGAVGAPGGVVTGNLPIVSRLVLAIIGLVAWWYLFQCLVGTWGIRVRRGEPSQSGSVAIPWLVFVVVFYLHGLLLGQAWQTCRTGQPGTNMVHVLTSSFFAAVTCVLSPEAIARTRNIRSGEITESHGVVAVVGAFGAVVVLLWPAMAVWHVFSGTYSGSCGSTGVPWWRPSLLSI